MTSRVRTWLVAIATVACVATGVSAQQIPPTCALAAIFAVPATSPWVDSGVTLIGGEKVLILSKAAWKPDPGLSDVDSMGRISPCDPTNPNCPVHANHGALVGRLGSNPAFIAGSSYAIANTRQNGLGISGTISFMINDATDHLEDNSGSAVVVVAFCP